MNRVEKLVKSIACEPGVLSFTYNPIFTMSLLVLTTANYMVAQMAAFSELSFKKKHVLNHSVHEGKKPFKCVSCKYSRLRKITWNNMLLQYTKERNKTENAVSAFKTTRTLTKLTWNLQFSFLTTYNKYINIHTKWAGQHLWTTQRKIIVKQIQII